MLPGVTAGVKARVKFRSIAGRQRSTALESGVGRPGPLRHSVRDARNTPFVHAAGVPRWRGETLIGSRGSTSSCHSVRGGGLMGEDYASNAPARIDPLRTCRAWLML